MIIESAGWLRPAPRVICLGLSAWDHVWKIASLLQGSGKNRAEHYLATGGGMAATAAVAVAKLGGVVSFWGRAGQDVAGRAMVDELQQLGVDTRHFRLFEGARSSESCVLVDPSGERQIVNYRGHQLPPDATWLPLEQLDNVGAVLADPRWLEGAITLFEAARKRGVVTVLDADVADSAVFEQLLPLTDHAIFSEQALAAFAGSHNALEKVAAYGCKVAAVTRGKHGVEWLENGRLSKRAAFKVHSVDTTGAGDVFHGAWTMAVAAGASTEDAASFSAAAAALKCTRFSGRSGIPTFSETLDLWKPKT